ncbi:hypothetical protein [Chamaesiphon polymorphus]|uniref:Uncharacterized protein n=1 Tax=Chamaesiphon polymorphus CCALA 037 TaxID=2107692 RepID=A0A2T1G281_9CYAN|nr:hypothetical protein [Chamaesiphon polymorphus]PSB51331.1 hypothetical protein C7B77_21715 [Chamaesiphon polymorphus CCALA 037]
MASKQVIELIAAAHRDRATKLDLSSQNLTELPESICDLNHYLLLDRLELFSSSRSGIGFCILDELNLVEIVFDRDG